MDSIAKFLAKFCGPCGYIAQTEDPILADFLTDLYEQGVDLAAARLATSPETIKGRIRDFVVAET